tara:strand:- start:1147 stop:2361 length:1215 start_codon:yes stop_codon:yes gene_type:complete
MPAIPNQPVNNPLENPQPVTPTTTVPVYNIQTQGLPSYDLMNYGMAGNTPYEFVKAVQTGSVTFDNQDESHQEMIRRYQEMMDQGALPPDAPSLDDLLKGTAASFAAPVGAAIGAQFATSPDLSPMLNLKTGLSEGFKLSTDPLSMALKSKDFVFPDLEAGQVFQPEFYNAATAKRAGVSAEFNKLTKAGDLNKGVILEDKVNRQDFDLAKGITKDVDTTFGDRLMSKSNIGGAFGAGIGAIGVNLLMGKNLKESVKSGVGVGLGQFIGNAIFPGFGGFIGSALGGVLGGRVICNELMRQGLMTRKHVLLDYKFTRDHLTPTHVKGYHLWALWMVKQMRKGKFVKFWKHVAGHRANEIAYIYGERDKPDYLGKVYRKILEPICWSVGLLCKKSDWSILYKTKEI